MSVNVRWTTAASRISNGRSSPILHEMRTGRSISKTEFNCSIRRRYLAAGFTLGDFAVQASWTNARRLHGALHRFNSPKIVSLDFLSGENPATKADKAPPTVPSSFLRHRVGRLCTVLDIAFHLKTGRKLRVGWRERLRFNAFHSIRCRESRPVFIQLLACALFTIETAFQVRISVLHLSGASE